jgi:UDP-GlcNAc:undecaprenyl-phosphate/decaprenyl-phosphate GlcNAc-1-phosphate transferase
MELCDSAPAAIEIVERTAKLLGCELIQVSCVSPDSLLRMAADDQVRTVSSAAGEVSGPGAIFRLPGGEGFWITVRVELGSGPDLAADIVFRYLERLGQELAGRLEWFRSLESDASVTASADQPARVAGLITRTLRMTPRLPRGHGGPSAARLHVVESVAVPTSLAQR